MTDGASNLLRDVALLLRRYSPEDFEELARLLLKPDFVSALSTVLLDVGSAARRIPTRRPSKRRTDPLEDVRSSDPEKHALLQAAKELLLDKTVHERLSDLTSAIEASGVRLPGKRYKRREDVVRAFVRAASGMPTKHLRRALEKLGETRSTSDLRSWSDIIMPQKTAPVG